MYHMSNNCETVCIIAPFQNSANSISTFFVSLISIAQNRHISKLPPFFHIFVLTCGIDILLARHGGRNRKKKQRKLMGLTSLIAMPVAFFQLFELFCQKTSVTPKLEKTDRVISKNGGKKGKWVQLYPKIISKQIIRKILIKSV